MLQTPQNHWRRRRRKPKLRSLLQQRLLLLLLRLLRLTPARKRVDLAGYPKAASFSKLTTKILMNKK
jgi:hypothetical protein